MTGFELRISGVRSDHSTNQPLPSTFIFRHIFCQIRKFFFFLFRENFDSFAYPRLSIYLARLKRPLLIIISNGIDFSVNFSVAEKKPQKV